MSDQPTRIQTGDCYDSPQETERGNRCVCCGAPYIVRPLCVCAATDVWVQDERRQRWCAVHAGQSMALSGGFTIPTGPGRRRETGETAYQPTYKRPDERAVRPIVHR